MINANSEFFQRKARQAEPAGPLLETCSYCRNHYLIAVQDEFCPHRIKATRQLGDGSGIHRSALTFVGNPKPETKRRPDRPPRPPLVLAEPFWGPQFNEHPKRYEAALIYFEMPAPRSFAGVSEEFRKRGLKKTPQLIGRWAREDKWDVRAQSYDVHKFKERRSVADRLYRKEIERQLKACQAAQFIGAAGMAEVIRRVKRGEPLDLTASDSLALRFLDFGIKGARLVLGDPTEHTLSEQVSPQMVYERRLRDAVMRVRESEKTMPDVPQATRMEWASEDYKVALTDIQSAFSDGLAIDDGAVN